MKPFPCIESTIDITDLLTGKTVRLWINRDDIPDEPAPEAIREIAEKVQQEINKSLGYNKALIEELAKIPNVNAVQVLEPVTGTYRPRYGTVVYTVPFESDVHG